MVNMGSYKQQRIGMPLVQPASSNAGVVPPPPPDWPKTTLGNQHLSNRLCAKDPLGANMWVDGVGPRKFGRNATEEADIFANSDFVPDKLFPLSNKLRSRTPTPTLPTNP